MSLVYTYADGYLAPLVSPEREARAIDDVQLLGALPSAWVQRLVVLRAYVLTCQESQKGPDDVFSAKLKGYRTEYADALAQARALQAASATSAPSGAASFFTVSLDRA